MEGGVGLYLFLRLFERRETLISNQISFIQLECSFVS